MIELPISGLKALGMELTPILNSSAGQKDQCVEKNRVNTQNKINGDDPKNL